MLEEVQYYTRELLRLTNQRQQILDKMVQVAQPLPEYEIFLSVPGIAATTAVSFIEELGYIWRFHSVHQINAFIGNDLRQYESGIYNAQEHLAKRGNPYARKILFKAIHNIISASCFKSCPISDF